MTNEELKQKFIEEEEEILWEGTPDKLGYFSRTDICLVPITLIFGGLLLSYAYSSFMLMLEGKSVTFALSGITVLLIAFYLIFGRIWYRHKRLSKNLYVVTNRRAIVINALRDTVTADIPLNEVYPDVFRNDLYLSYKHLGGDMVYGLGLDIFFRNMSTESPAFYAISDPQKVEKLLKKAMKNYKKAANGRKETSDASDDSDFI